MTFSSLMYNVFPAVGHFVGKLVYIALLPFDKFLAYFLNNSTVTFTNLFTGNSVSELLLPNVRSGGIIGEGIASGIISWFPVITTPLWVVLLEYSITIFFLIAFVKFLVDWL